MCNEIIIKNIQPNDVILLKYNLKDCFFDEIVEYVEQIQKLLPENKILAIPSDIMEFTICPKQELINIRKELNKIINNIKDDD